MFLDILYLLGGLALLIVGANRLVKGASALAAVKAPWVPAGSDLVRLNREAMFRELNLIKHMISVGRMRELVELRCYSSPWSVWPP